MIKTPVDVRIPADASDRQTVDAKTPLPPLDFAVTRNATLKGNQVSIIDRSGPQDRSRAVQYRVYFLPGITDMSQPSSRLGGQKGATLVATVAAPSLGSTLVTVDTANYGLSGSYFCVSVNRVGTEGPPENVFGAPLLS